MIAYNRQWLDNEEAVMQIEDQFVHHNITADEKAAAMAQYPSGFYTPNIFISAGLAILSVVIIGFSFGLLALLFINWSNNIEDSAAKLCIIFGMAAYASLEWFVQVKHHYNSGVDTALLWISAGFLLTGLNFLFNVGGLTNAVVIFIMAIYLTLRFADRLMAAIAALASLAIVVFASLQIGAWATTILPFTLMIASALLYFANGKMTKIAALHHYKKCITLTRITGLVCFYLSGNYFVVKEGRSELLYMQDEASATVPFAWIFWLFTVAIPLFYLAWGLMKKDAVILRTGLVLIAGIVFTIKYYHHILPMETLMIISGLLMIILAYSCTRYLKIPRFGFTSAEAHCNRRGLNVEALIIAETLSGPQQAEPGTHFGGGGFGGGGASGEY